MSYDRWKTRSPDDERDQGEFPPPDDELAMNENDLDSIEYNKTTGMVTIVLREDVATDPLGATLYVDGMANDAQRILIFSGSVLMHHLEKGDSDWYELHESERSIV